MHDLTKKMVRAWIPAGDVERWIVAGMDIVYHMTPEEVTTVEERIWVGRCVSAAMALIREAKLPKMELRQYAWLLSLCASFNLHHGQWALSREQFEKTRPLYEQHLGKDHPRTLKVLHSLSLAARHCGDMAASEKYCRQAWELYEAKLGPNATETLQVLNDLAATIERSGRLKEAESMFGELYTQAKIKSGPQSPMTMAAAHNLALCLHNQGRLGEAETMYLTSLKASEEYLDPKDRGTLKTLANYAATLDHDGRFEEAEAVYNRALIGFIGVMGFDHYLTLRLRGNMAGLLRQQGKFAQAEIMMSHSLETAEEILGSKVFETIHGLYEMGEVWQAKGDIRKALDAFSKVMGRLPAEMMRHPVVFRFIDSWGAIEREMGHLGVSLEKSKDAYDRFMGLLGWNDPYTLMAANDYAEVLHAEGRYQEAWDLLVRCRDSFAGLLGKGHPHYAMTSNNLGRLCWALKVKDAMPFFAEAHGALTARLDGSHYCSMTVSLNIARTTFFSGDIQGAIGAIKETQGMLKATIGAEHPLCLACDTIVGIIFAARGDRGSLVTAKEHLLAAMEAASKTEYTASADYFLNICLLILVLRRLQSEDSEIRPLLAILRGPAAREVSPWDIPGFGRFSAGQLAVMDYEKFDFGAYIPLAIGETFRLRWGRKTCWREADSARLME